MLFFKILRSSSCVQRVTLKSLDNSLLKQKLQFDSTSLSPIRAINVRHNHSDGKENIVYTGPLSRQVKSVKLFTLITSLTGICAQPVIYEKAIELGTSTPILIAVYSFVGFFTVATPLLLHFVTKKYVTNVTYNSEQDLYSASVYTLLLQKRIITFKPGEAVIPDILGMFTTISIRGIPLFLDPSFFDDVNHYKRIMGYDKPIDFKMSTSTSSKSEV